MSQTMIIEMEGSYNLSPKVVDYIKSKGFNIQHTQLATWMGNDGPYQIYKRVWMECASIKDAERMYQAFGGCARYSRDSDGILFEIDD